LKEAKPRIVRKVGYAFLDNPILWSESLLSQCITKVIGLGGRGLHRRALAAVKFSGLAI
jgi:hypothetical protein